MYRLLVVDDRQEVCDGIVKLLDWNSYDFTTVATATTYQEAISKAVDLQPHIALVSVRIGHHFGYELAAYIRSIGMKTVFCVIFGYDDPHYMQKCMQAGVRDYLQNAPDPKELQLFVERTIIRDFKGTIPSAVNLQGKIDQVLNMDYTGFSSITNKIILYVKSDYRYSLSLSSIAALLHMNSKYIGRVFLKDTGMKFTEYLMAYRMLEARRLIKNTQENIAVIASMVGYSHSNNFYVHFKSYFGCSPGTLRDFRFPTK